MKGRLAYNEYPGPSKIGIPMTPPRASKKAPNISVKVRKKVKLRARIAIAAKKGPGGKRTPLIKKIST